MRSYAVIVDPYSSGSLLAKEFERFDIVPIALHMRPLVGKLAKSFIPDDFGYSYVFDGNVDNILKQLSEHNVRYVVPGQEAGVGLADELCHRMGLKCNDISLSCARRDKYEMHQKIREDGLRTIKQIKADRLDVVLDWVETHQTWPVVIKPVDSGGTDGVKICKDVDQVRSAWDAIISKTNLLGFSNTNILAQETISGTEYVVDTVSCNGKHYVSSMTLYEKEILENGSPIYRTMRFFAPDTDNELHQQLIAYTEKVLDSLGVVVGPAHTEIFIDDNGPVLVETGARLFGGLIPKYQAVAATVSPLELAIDSYVDEVAFADKTQERQTYHQELLIWMMGTKQEGKLLEQPGKRLVQDLPSYYDSIWFSAPGDNIVATRDIVSGVGLLIMVSDNAAQIQQDVVEVKHWENENALLRVQCHPANNSPNNQNLT